LCQRLQQAEEEFDDLHQPAPAGSI
jgi:hypothetical protein